MNIFSKYTCPGKHNFLVDGSVGLLEVELFIPNSPNYNFVGVLGHPHSLHGGTMNNKVVTTTASAFANLNIPSIKFNFRGVGNSDGEYDAGIGESIDMLLIAKLWKDLHPNCQLIFAGFSFGSYVAYRAAFEYKSATNENAPLITIAPSVDNYNYAEYPTDNSEWLIIQGSEDEIVPAANVFAFAKQHEPAIQVMEFLDTTHFFHGKLVELKTKLTNHLTDLIQTI